MTTAWWKIHEAGETGAYQTTADFDVAGLWGVEVTGTTADGQIIEPLRPAFSVEEERFGLSSGRPGATQRADAAKRR